MMRVITCKGKSFIFHVIQIIPEINWEIKQMCLTFQSGFNYVLYPEIFYQFKYTEFWHDIRPAQRNFLHRIFENAHRFKKLGTHLIHAMCQYDFSLYTSDAYSNISIALKTSNYIFVLENLCTKDSNFRMRKLQHKIQCINGRNIRMFKGSGLLYFHSFENK